MITINFKIINQIRLKIVSSVWDTTYQLPKSKMKLNANDLINWNSGNTKPQKQR